MCFIHIIPISSVYPTEWVSNCPMDASHIILPENDWRTLIKGEKWSKKISKILEPLLGIRLNSKVFLEGIRRAEHNINKAFGVRSRRYGWKSLFNLLEWTDWLWLNEFQKDNLLAANILTMKIRNSQVIYDLITRNYNLPFTICTKPETLIIELQLALIWWDILGWFGYIYLGKDTAAIRNQWIIEAWKRAEYNCLSFIHLRVALTALRPISVMI